MPLLAIVLGLAVGIVFVIRQLRLPEPMIDMGLFRITKFNAALVTNFLAIFMAVGYFLFVAQYLQLIVGLSPLEAGLWSLPSAFGFIIGSQFAPRVLRGPRQHRCGDISWRVGRSPSGGCPGRGRRACQGHVGNGGRRCGGTVRRAGGTVRAVAFDAFVRGMQVASYIAVVVAVAVIGLVLVLLRDEPPGADQSDEEARKTRLRWSDIGSGPVKPVLPDSGDYPVPPFWWHGERVAARRYQPCR